VGSVNTVRVRTSRELQGEKQLYKNNNFGIKRRSGRRGKGEEGHDRERYNHQLVILTQ